MSQEQPISEAIKDNLSSNHEEVEQLGAGYDQMVPVAEAIKYRRRAQAAESKVQQLNQGLQLHEEQQKELETRLDKARLENELIRSLSQAGTADMEAALLLVKERMSKQVGEQRDFAGIIQSLRKEKPYLFSLHLDESAYIAPGLSSGIRCRESFGGTTLRKLAERARQSGARRDMHEYLRVRRGVMA